ncbi:RNA 3'-terminal phosphate cyclase-like protein [Lemmus lemmus]
MAEGTEHRPTTDRANGGAEGATPCSPTDQWQRAPAPGPPQPGEEAGRRPLAPPRSPLTRCLVALSSCSKPRGRVGGRRGPCRVPSSRPSADYAHMATQAHSLSYAGCNFLRQRLVLSTLSGRPVKIRRIRARDDNPGLRDFEASFIRLLDKLTNGSRIEINQTGTTLYYQPGLLYGGSVEHDCSVLRGIGYYLEALLCLAPFMKHPLKIVLRGVTNDQVDPSVDVLKATALPLLKQFGIDGESFELKILRRGMPPGGGGEVLFSCPVRKVLKPVQLTDPGKIKRIRGMAYSVRVSPQMANRIVDSARSVLNKFIPDIYIYTDHMKGVNSGKSPGFGLSLVAETTNGTFLSAELASNPQGQGAAVLPEDLGRNCAKLLLEEIYRGGCVDSTNQSLVLLLMTLGQQDVSKVLLGPLSPYTIEFLRHLKSFFQVMFKIETKPCGEELKGGDKVLMTCVGIGFSNLSKTLK